MNAILDNGNIRLTIDETGKLTELVLHENGINPLRPYCLWRAVMEYDSCREVEARPFGKVAIDTIGNRTELRFTQCVTRKGEVLPLDAVCTITLSGEEIRFGATVRNIHPDTVIREFQYPILGIRRGLNRMSVIDSIEGGERYHDFYSNIQKWRTAYCQQDNKYLRRQYLYPGLVGAMNCFVLDFKDWGVYYGCHDPEFDSTMHVMELEQKTEDFNLYMARYPFLPFQEEWQTDLFVVSPYRGTWHCAASKYRAWAEKTWFSPPAVPAAVRRSEGWQRLILRQQCGDLIHPYSTLMKAWEDGRKAGIDTLFLFGWTRDGMDAGYPVYLPDERQGGTEALKKAIRKIQSCGGKIILYFNGQLIDMESEYYRNGEGKAVCIKRHDGSEHREFYNFGGEGTWLNWFGNKAFTVACPAAESWKKILFRHIDFALELGVDSIFFDQTGSIQHPCHDPSHGHKVPFTGIMNAKRRLLKELREYLKAKSPETGIGIEIISDQTAQFADFIHICVASKVRSYSEHGIEPFLEFFKYTFPEIILSNRDIRDERDPIEPAVNEMFLLGSHSDVEIYRCRETIAETPHYQEYLGKVNALRERFADILLTGRFNSTLGYVIDEPQIRSNAFLLEDRMAVVLTHRREEELSVAVHVPGYHFVRMDSARGDARLENGRLFLPEYSLCVMLYRKNGC